MKEGFVFSQKAQEIQDILNYIEQQLPGALQALADDITNETNRAKGRENGLADDIANETNRATTKENELADAMQGLIPKSEKGQANGVASLNADGMVPVEQLQFPNRGALNPADINRTDIKVGLYQVNGKVIGQAILNGEGANGIFIQYPWGSRVQVLLVGRASGASAGEQVELYVRRYLPTPQRWTAWMTTADFAKKSDIPESDFYVVEFEYRGGSVTTKQSISDIFAARDSGKQIIGTFGDRSPVYFYYEDLDSVDVCPLISLKKIRNGIAYYDGYGINLNGTITRFNYQVGVNASNFIQKSITAGLVKNDGTIDKTTYATGSQLAQLSDTVDALDNDVDNIEVVIPSAASAQNQLADKDFVNHSVATNTANFIGTFQSVADLEAYSGTLTNNDYAFVIVTDAQGNEFYDRYKYNGHATPPAWLFEYRIESTAFTAPQWAAIQSGITSALVTKLQGLENYDDTSIRNAITLIEQNYATNTALNALSQTVDGKQAKVAIEAPTDTTDPTQPITTLSCEVGKYYRIDVAVDTLAVTLPAVTGNIAETVVLYLTAGTTPAVTIASASAGVEVLYHFGYEIAAGKTYEINCLWNGAAWVVASVEIVINN